MIPISRFNKGEANKIFEEVHQDGIKIVVKNNKPACVLISPEEYEALIETIENYKLFIQAEKRMAEKRMAENENTSYKSHLQVMESLDITQDELDNIEVDLE
jgi:prevent-host-death family protein